MMATLGLEIMVYRSAAVLLHKLVQHLYIRRDSNRSTSINIFLLTFLNIIL